MDGGVSAAPTMRAAVVAAPGEVRLDEVVRPSSAERYRGTTPETLAEVSRVLDRIYGR